MTTDPITPEIRDLRARIAKVEHEATYSWDEGTRVQAKFQATQLRSELGKVIAAELWRVKYPDPPLVRQ